MTNLQESMLLDLRIEPATVHPTELPSPAWTLLLHSFDRSLSNLRHVSLLDLFLLLYQKFLYLMYSMVSDLGLHCLQGIWTGSTLFARYLTWVYTICQVCDLGLHWLPGIWTWPTLFAMYLTWSYTVCQVSDLGLQCLPGIWPGWVYNVCHVSDLGLQCLPGIWPGSTLFARYLTWVYYSVCHVSDLVYIWPGSTLFAKVKSFETLHISWCTD